MSISHQIPAHLSWAQTPDRAARTSKARAAKDRKFEAEVDPDGVMTPADRAKAVGNARKAYYLRLAQASAAARRT